MIDYLRYNEDVQGIHIIFTGRIRSRGKRGFGGGLRGGVAKGFQG